MSSTTTLRLPSIALGAGNTLVTTPPAGIIMEYLSELMDTSGPI